MKLSQALTIIALATQSINAASLPEANTNIALDVLSERAPDVAAIVSPDHTLERRKGGGGRGGGSSGGGSSGGGRSTGGGSSSGSSRTSPSSFSGGSTRAGSGPARSFGGGRYYGGGAAVPYQAGGRTPKGLIAGALIAPVLILAIMPGLWLYSVYPYQFNNPYRFHNETQTNQNPNGTNSSLPVVCLCQEYSVCGCEENDDQSYINGLIGNGSYPALNKSLVTVADYNGKQSIIINGTLPNGTTAPGGEDDSAAVNLALGKYTGWWAMGLIVIYGIIL